MLTSSNGDSRPVSRKLSENVLMLLVFSRKEAPRDPSSSKLLIADENVFKISLEWMHEALAHGIWVAVEIVVVSSG
jgi:hypothetical protein